MPVKLTSKEREFSIRKIDVCKDWKLPEIGKTIRNQEMQNGVENLYTFVRWLKNLNVKSKNVKC